MTLIDLQPWIIDAIAISFTTQLADPRAANRTFTCLLRRPENGESLVLERKFFCPSLTCGYLAAQLDNLILSAGVLVVTMRLFGYKILCRTNFYRMLQGDCYQQNLCLMIWWNRVYYKSAFSWRETLRSETSVIFDRSWQGKYLSWGEDRESVFFEAFRRTHTPWGGADLWRCEYLVFGLDFEFSI